MIFTIFRNPSKSSKTTYYSISSFHDFHHFFKFFNLKKLYKVYKSLFIIFWNSLRSTRLKVLAEDGFDPSTSAHPTMLSIQSIGGTTDAVGFSQRYFVFWWLHPMTDTSDLAEICSLRRTLFYLKILAEDGFDPSTSGLWAQHASAAPLCYHTPQMGLEPIIPGLGGQCLIH